MTGFDTPLLICVEPEVHRALMLDAARAGVHVTRFAADILREHVGDALAASEREREIARQAKRDAAETMGPIIREMSATITNMAAIRGRPLGEPHV